MMLLKAVNAVLGLFTINLTALQLRTTKAFTTTSTVAAAVRSLHISRNNHRHGLLYFSNNHQYYVSTFDPFGYNAIDGKVEVDIISSNQSFGVVVDTGSALIQSSHLSKLHIVTAMPTALIAMVPTFPANAYSSELLAVNTAQIPSALFAYAHFSSLAVILGCLAVERTTLSTNMNAEQEKKVYWAELTYGIFGMILIISGYFRATDPSLGKGWDFYSHEPIFWLKMTLFGIIFGLSCFPTVTYLKRGLNYRKEGSFGPAMSPELIKRLHKLINAEILAFLTIPFTASLMARGVGYWNEFPWPFGAALVTLATTFFTVRYTKEALDWKEPDGSSIESATAAAK